MKVVLALLLVVLISCPSQGQLPPMFKLIGSYSKKLFLNSVWVGLTATLISATDDGEAKSYYTVPDIQLTWHGALLTCRSFGMHLLSISTQEEYTELKKIIQKHSDVLNFPAAFNYIYIGGKVRSGCTDLNRMNTQECWYWLSSGLPISTVKWHGDEPNDLGDCEDCLAIEANDVFGLADVPCNNFVKPFICESVASGMHSSSHDESSQISSDLWRSAKSS